MQPRRQVGGVSVSARVRLLLLLLLPVCPEGNCCCTVSCRDSKRDWVKAQVSFSVKSFYSFAFATNSHPSSFRSRCTTSGSHAAFTLWVGVRFHLKPALWQIQDATSTPDDHGAIVSTQQLSYGCSNWTLSSICYHHNTSDCKESKTSYFFPFVTISKWIKMKGMKVNLFGLHVMTWLHKLT